MISTNSYMTYHYEPITSGRWRPGCALANAPVQQRLFNSGLRIVVCCLITIFMLSERTIAQDSTGEIEVVGTVEDALTGEVEVVGTVEGVEDTPTGEVEVVGTVEGVEAAPTGEVEVVGTIATPRTAAQLSSWAQIKLLQESGFR